MNTRKSKINSAESATETATKAPEKATATAKSKGRPKSVAEKKKPSPVRKTKSGKNKNPAKKKSAQNKKKDSEEAVGTPDYETVEEDDGSDIEAIAREIEIQELKKRLAKLETAKSGLNPAGQKEKPRNPPVTPVRSPERRRVNPMDGKMLGCYDGKGDLDSFLTKFERCSSYFGWTESDKLFQLCNALSDATAYILKEVGPEGKLEEIISLLKIRFGSDMQIEKFRAELQNRKRQRGEPLKDLYLDLTRLKIHVYGNEKYPDVYFRDIYVNALNDKELRKAVLIQKPSTMEDAYNISCRLEALDAYDKQVEIVRPNHRIQVLGTVNPAVNPDGLKIVADENKTVVLERQVAELRDTVLDIQRKIDLPRQPSFFPTGRFSRVDNPGVQYYGQNKAENPSQSWITTEHCREAPRGPKVTGAGWPADQCKNCGGKGHWARQCNFPNRQRRQTVPTTEVDVPSSTRGVASPKQGGGELL